MVGLEFYQYSKFNDIITCAFIILSTPRPFLWFLVLSWPQSLQLTRESRCHLFLFRYRIFSSQFLEKYVLLCWLVRLIHYVCWIHFITKLSPQNELFTEFGIWNFVTLLSNKLEGAVSIKILGFHYICRYNSRGSRDTVSTVYKHVPNYGIS